MDTNQLAAEIASQISSGIELRIAIISVIGVVVGAMVTIFGNLVLHYFQSEPERKLDRQRKELLRSMLSGKKYEWMHVTTLAAVIGASEEETKRLLIDIGARGSQTKSGSWALLSRKPLPQSETDE